jgi:hypothetical protein
MPKSAARTPSRVHALLARLPMVARLPSFSHFSVVAKSLFPNFHQKISTAIMVDVPMEPNSNPLIP